MTSDFLALGQQAFGYLAPLLHPGWVQVQIVYSQAGASHESRVSVTYPDGFVAQANLPADSLAALAQLRRLRAEAGSLFYSMMIVVAAGSAPAIYFNDSQRPYWNSPTLDLLTPSKVAIPDLAGWQVDLEQFPGIAAPQWLVITPDGVELSNLAKNLLAADIPSGWVELDAGDAPAQLGAYGTGPWCEGRVVLRRVGPGYYSLSVCDYGQDRLLANYTEELPACSGLWHYLQTPMPAPRVVSGQELAQAEHAARATYEQLRNRLANVGPGGLVTTMPAGLYVDHIGGFDGVHVYPAGTPSSQRSLPPGALSAPGSDTRTYLTLQAIEVQAQVVEPWFDQPGGGLRMTLAGTTIRQAVLAGALVPISH